MWRMMGGYKVQNTRSDFIVNFAHGCSFSCHYGQRKL